jgi:hypothetical protein
MSIFPTDEEIMEGLKNENERLLQKVADLKKQLADNKSPAELTQAEIKRQYDEIYGKLKKLRRDFKHDEQELIEIWQDLQDECQHPNKQGVNEGYCPDCGYTFG